MHLLWKVNSSCYTLSMVLLWTCGINCWYQTTNWTPLTRIQTSIPAWSITKGALIINHFRPPEFTPCSQWGSCCSIFSFCVMFCRSLFVFLSFFFWSLCRLSLFDLPLWYLQTFLTFVVLLFTSDQWGMSVRISISEQLSSHPVLGGVRVARSVYCFF